MAVVIFRNLHAYYYRKEVKTMSKIRDFIESADWVQIAGYALVAVGGFVLGYTMKEPEAKDVAYISLKGDPEMLKKAIEHTMDETE